MATDCTRKKAHSLTLLARGHRFASTSRAALLGITLCAWVFAAGCIGLTGNPNAKTTGGTSSSGGTSSGGSSSGSQSSQLSPSSSEVTFGNVTVGSSTSQLVTLTAAGSGNVKISRVTASGAGFSVSGGSNVTLAPGQSVTVSVGFQPGTAGTDTGKLRVSSDASNSSLAISLTGDGVAASTINHSVALNWEPSASPVIGYFVFRGSSASDLTQLNINEVATTSYKDTNVADGRTYVYAVKSINANSVLSGFSNTVTVTVPAQ